MTTPIDVNLPPFNLPVHVVHLDQAAPHDFFVMDPELSRVAVAPTRDIADWVVRQANRLRLEEVSLRTRTDGHVQPAVIVNGSDGFRVYEGVASDYRNWRVSLGRRWTSRADLLAFLRDKGWEPVLNSDAQTEIAFLRELQSTLADVTQTDKYSEQMLCVAEARAMVRARIETIRPTPANESGQSGRGRSDFLFVAFILFLMVFVFSPLLVEPRSLRDAIPPVVIAPEAGLEAWRMVDIQICTADNPCEPCVEYTDGSVNDVVACYGDE